jgi:hypothetical protein
MSTPAVGTLCAFRFSEDGMWHVQPFSNSLSSVNISDFGTAAVASVVPTLGTAALATVGTGAGNIPQVPLPMSVMPVAKARIDVHPFSFTVPGVRRSGAFTLTTPPGLSAFFNVIAYQSAVPGTNKGILPDAREFDQILMTADIINDTTLRISWIATGPVTGNYNAYYQIKN